MNREQRRRTFRLKTPRPVSIQLHGDRGAKLITLLFSDYVNNFSLTPEAAREHAGNLLKMADEIDPQEEKS